jgi:hypothetical protein
VRRLNENQHFAKRFNSENLGGASPRFEQLCDRREKFLATGIVVTRELLREAERNGQVESLETLQG